jgi:DNA-binding response OmpR family regulator
MRSKQTHFRKAPVVLLVEDEFFVRMAAADDLADEGFHVLEAGTADVALAVLETFSDEVQAVFTDIDMPGSMNGLRLAEEVHRRWPHIVLMIASGDHKLRNEEVPDHGQFFAKPYSTATVAERIREQLKGH